MRHGEVKRTVRRVAPELYRRAAEAYWTLRRMPLRPPSSQSQPRLQTIRSIARQAARVSPDPLGRRIVFFTVRGWPVHLAVESLLASRLRALGHDVRFLICSDSLPFCMISSVHAPPAFQRPCDLCCKRKNSAFADIFPT